jgi:hypothetical protein
MTTIATLAQRMRAKREFEGGHPYVLVLGAGASVASGTQLNRAVVERVVGRYDLQAFDDYLQSCSDDERFAILRELVEGTSPSRGYRCLAELIQAGYFDVILSTNFDPLLEDAIAALPMRRRDYVLLVHGVMEPQFVVGHLDNLYPRVKVLKLHGDLFYRKFYYTGAEIDEFPEPIRQALELYLNQRDLLIVGHGMQDSDINRCLHKQGGSIWWVGPSPPQGEIAELIRLRKSERNVISGQLGRFDAFFEGLHAELLGGTAAASVDQISQVIMSISRTDGQVVGSGFVLGTDLLVSDSSILTALVGQSRALGARAVVRPFAGGPQREAELVMAPETALDYAVFRVPGLIERSSLELADELPKVGEPVTACISVGDSQGFHDGTVTGVERTVSMQGFNRQMMTISNLIETDIRVAPGSCGSPLVRKDGRVVGAIVAGHTQAKQSFALTSLRLREMLQRSGLLPR